MFQMNHGEFTICPYDNTHRILVKRFQRHLDICRRNHPTSTIINCPYNITHRLKEPELGWHVMNCPERIYFISTDNKKAGEPKKLRYEKPLQEVVCEEDWDALPPEPTYNPQNYAENAPVFRVIQGAAPAKRKAFRKSERERLTKLKYNQDCEHQH